MDEEDNYDEPVIDLEHLDSLNEKSGKSATNEYYARPPLDETVSEASSLILMQIDCDYYVVREGKTQRPVIRMYGITERGHSVLAHIHRFEPYFYVQMPPGFDKSEENLENFRLLLNERAKSNKNIGKDEEAVQKISVVQKESVKNYKCDVNSKISFLKIVTHLPSYVGSLRGIFEKTISYKGVEFGKTTFESSVPFALRFMIDLKIVGMMWIKLPEGSFKFRQGNKVVSRCQAEVDVNYDEIEPLNPEGEWSKIGPLRCLSFDIECAPEKGFPQDTKDPIIQIAAIVKIHTHTTHLVKTIFCLDTCSNIVDADVRSFKTERELLEAWERFFQVSDPDIVLGYNTINFDFPYIINRGKQLLSSGKKGDHYGYFGRMLGAPSKIKDGKYLSKAMGMRDTKEINLEGRIQLDMMIQMHRDFKLSSYSLNNVSQEFLKEQKEDVAYNEMYALQFKGNADTRRRIAVYCLKDAYLPLRLMEKLMCLYNHTEMARVTGVPLNFLFTRGQQIKVASQMYREAAKFDMVIPTERSKGSEGKFEGAFVLNPKTSHYTKPIATLDFASLYPSIMMAHNLCYTTLIPTELVKKIDPSNYTRTPIGHCFIKPHVRKGLLPHILEGLINARKRARKELAEATDPFVKAVLDGRQLALKISANSVYGFTGAQVGQLPCLEISASVTAFGRQMIEKTRDKVLTHYTKANGYKEDADVIYGDTDSVMVKFGVDTVAEAMALGKEAADLVSKEFISPIKLEFEKVYYPYLLFNRKRYAGLLWTKPEKYDKIDKKGIESVRRDNCALIRIMINEILRMILVERNVELAIDYTKGIISDLLQNKIDMSLLVITKSLSKKSADDEDENDDGKKKDSAKSNNVYKAKQAHVELANKMKKRDAGTAPHIGDRVPYVMVAGARGSRNFENAEDPIYVLQNDLPLDFDYYIEKQLKGPLVRIFELIISNPNSLFIGEHTKVIYVPKLSNKISGLGKFAIIKNTCLGCKVEIKAGAICPNCENKRLAIYTQKLLEMNELQEGFSELWTQCQRCQGSLHHEVLCSNRDCPIFYRRTKVQKDLTNQIQVLSRFENDW